MKLSLQRRNLFLILCLWIFVAVSSRLLPHIANATPFIAMSVLASQFFNRSCALVFVMGGLFLSDLLLGIFSAYPIFGTWMIFTYSALMMITWVISFLPRYRFLGVLVVAFLANIIFWLWTNLGTWLMSGLYPVSAFGLKECYLLALPFLRNSILATLIWLPILWFGLQSKFIGDKCVIP